jgi:hypothetical protein
MTRRGLRVRMILPALTEATSPFFGPRGGLLHVAYAGG